MAYYIQRFWNNLIGRVSKRTFERRRSTENGIFAFLGVTFAQCFEQIVSIRVKKLGYTNLIASRQIKGAKARGGGGGTATYGLYKYVPL